MTIIDRFINWLEKRELARARVEIACLKETNRLMEPRWKYLNGRDALCSDLANKLNKAMFEIGSLKGQYKETSGD